MIKVSWPADERLMGSNHELWFTRIEMTLEQAGQSDLIHFGLEPVPEDDAAPTSSRPAATATTSEGGQTERQSEIQPAADQDSVAAGRPLPRTAKNIQRDKSVKGFLGTTLTQEYFYVYRESESAKELWDKLKDLFVQKTKNRQIILLRELTTLKQRANETSHEYVSRARDLRNRCLVAGLATTEDQLVTHILNGLLPAYDLDRSLLVKIPGELTVDSVFQQLSLSEQQHMQSAASSEAIAFSATSRRPFSNANRSARHAFNGSAGRHFAQGRRGGHSGYGGTAVAGQQLPNTCWKCHQPGHFKADCPLLKAKRQQQQQRRPQPQQQLQQQFGQGAGRAYYAQAHMAVQVTTATDYNCRSAEPGEVSWDWLVDSGASNHICKDSEFFVKFRSFTDDELQMDCNKVQVGNGVIVQAFGVGNVLISTCIDPMGAYKYGQPATCKQFELENVLYVPDMTVNLISPTQLGMDQPVQLKCHQGTTELWVGDELFATTSSQHSGMPILQSYTVAEAEALACAKAYAFAAVGTTKAPRTKPNKVTVQELRLAKLWHRRIGHLGYRNLAKMPSMVTGLDVSSAAFRAAEQSSEVCEPCIEAKHSRDPFPSSETKSRQPLDLIHMDLCGPMPEATHSGCLYMATFLDDHSKLSVVRLLKHKKDLAQTLVDVINMLEKQSDRSVKKVRTDRGGEYVNQEVESWLVGKGILHQKTVPYSPQQNGAAERLNKTLCNLIRAMLFDAKLSGKFWGEAAHAANYIRNRAPASGLVETPYTHFFGEEPDVSLLRVFGCPAWVHVPQPFRKKLDKRSRKGTFVGYEPNTKGWRIWVNGKIVVSRDVIFEEIPSSEAPALMVKESSGSARPTAGTEVLVPVAKEDDANNAVGLLSNREPGQPPAQLGEVRVGGGGAALSGSSDSGNDGYATPRGQSATNSEDEAADLSGNDGGGDSGSDGAVSQPQPQVPRRSERASRQPDRLTYMHAAVTKAPQLTDEPQSYEEAMARPDAALWVQAMNEEMESLMQNNTYVLEELPAGAKAIQCKWVYKIKRDALGNIERYKARIVAKGYQQVPGVDFKELYAPVSKHSTFRVLLAIVAEFDLELDHVDIKSAFLNGDLEETIYMVQPPGYKQGDANVVCRLQKALYGLRQAPRAWHNKLKQELQKMGFECTEADPGLWVCEYKGTTTYLLAYVDDLALAGSREGVNRVKRLLLEKFAARDLGPAKLFLGLEIERQRGFPGCLKLSQPKFVMEVLEKFGMKHSNPVATPAVAGEKLSRYDGQPLDTRKYPYSALVGALLYLSVCTRPDIAQAVGVLSRFMAVPRDRHWVAAKRVLRYLAGSMLHGICFWPRQAQLEGWVDSDFASEVDARKSTTGFVFTLNGGAVAWSSKLQQTVATSTTEAEYMAASLAVKEALWLKKVLQVFAEVWGRGDRPLGPVQMHTDSQGALSLMKHEAASQRTKHIDVMYHFARERVARGEVVFEHCPTTLMVADCMTKALPSEKFSWSVLCMGMSESMITPSE